MENLALACRRCNSHKSELRQKLSNRRIALRNVPKAKETYDLIRSLAMKNKTA